MPRAVLGIASIVLLACVTVLDAGGWAVVTITAPDTVIVGQSVTVTYAVRQHGQRLVNELQGHVEARFSGAVVKAPARSLSNDGHYSATLTFPRAGTWTLDVVSGFVDSTGRAAIRAIQPGPTVPALTPIVKGGRLFVSKGCATCHVEGMASAAPVLAASGYEPQYLTQFLRRPPAPRGDEWRMPNLQLDDAEIASLVAYVNARRPRTESAGTAAHDAVTGTPELDKAASTCKVTRPNGQGTFLEDPSLDGYGNGLISTGLWSDGTVVFRPGGPGFVTSDGSLGMKWGWRRAIRGRLRIEGRRLDETAPPLRAEIPSGYSDFGFQATHLIFPTPGCWEVTGRVGATSLTFVTRVQKIGSGPSTPAPLVSAEQ
jgi:mono/diheme cytochrome c family protein